MTAVDLGSARKWAAALLDDHLGPGMRAVDATMGNGADSERMARLVGPSGRVWAFDVQPAALDKARARLEKAGLLARVELILDGHQHMERYVCGPVDAISFNLGWLPGGDKSVTTLAETTRPALDAALRLLGPGGLLTVCAYPGHPEGERERAAALDWAAGLDPARYQSRLTAYLNQPGGAPALIAVAPIR